MLYSGDGRLLQRPQWWICDYVSVSESVDCGCGVMLYSLPASGYSITHMLTGLKELNQYRCRLRASNEAGTGKWSEVITVATTSSYMVHTWYCC